MFSQSVKIYMYKGLYASNDKKSTFFSEKNVEWCWSCPMPFKYW